MKQRRRIFSAGVGMVMFIGSMVAFSSSAAALQGDLIFPGMTGTITLGGIAPVAIIGGAGSGAVAPLVQTPNTAGTWTSDLNRVTLAGNLACITFTVEMDDSISWNASPPNPPAATQTITNADIIIDSMACPFPPQGICNLRLNGAKNLTTDANGFPIVPAIAPANQVRQGTFDDNPGQVVGNYTLTNVAPLNNCLASGLAAQIAAALGNPPPIALPFFAFSNAPFAAQLTKTLQTI